MTPTTTRFDIVHTTTYSYRSPVTFGEHRVMFRPRDSHDQRVLATDLKVSMESIVRLIQDPHSNSVALVQPLGQATELKLVCSFSIEQAPGETQALSISPSGEYLPVSYSLQDRIDLEHYLRPHHDDPKGELAAWASLFMSPVGRTRTRDLLEHMNRHIGATLKYIPRDEEGTQSPTQTLALGSGSCRDYALLMMEAARRMGIATRFVSGYLYDAALDATHTHITDGKAIAGAGYTHAWLEAYLPGAGWAAFDPTNNIVGGSQLIRVGVARDPAFAAPVSGSWYGAADAYLGLIATVQVTRQG
jgi:transglutaminase-like putative cysteine protease